MSAVLPRGSWWKAGAWCNRLRYVPVLALLPVHAVMQIGDNGVDDGEDGQDGQDEEDGEDGEDDGDWEDDGGDRERG